jgi:hypothetical protein
MKTVLFSLAILMGCSASASALKSDIITCGDGHGISAAFVHVNGKFISGQLSHVILGDIEEVVTFYCNDNLLGDLQSESGQIAACEQTEDTNGGTRNLSMTLETGAMGEGLWVNVKSGRTQLYRFDGCGPATQRSKY